MYRFILLALFALAFSAPGGEGRRIDATWRIAVAPEATETERFAAQELQSHLRQITGLTLPVISEAGAEAPLLAIAATGEGTEPDADSFTVRSDANGVSLTGSNPRGALYAVYAFLREVAQVRWLWPGDSGTFLPESNEVVVPEGLLIRETGAFQYRGIHWCRQHYDAATELWGARNQLNIVRSFPIWSEEIRRMNDRRIVLGYHMMVSLHNVQLDKELMETHPEWFALADGRRRPEQLCWSNPEVAELMVERFSADIAKYPAIEIMSIFPADSLVRCHCPECSRLTTTDLWFALLKKIVAGVRQRYPEMKFAGLAYQIYQDPPSVGLGELDFIEYAMYDRCYVHPLNGCGINAKALASLERWRQRETPVGIYGYAFDMFETEGDMFVPWFTAMQDALITLKRLNIRSVITEGRPWGYAPETLGDPDVRHFNRNRLLYYLYCRLLWNPQLDMNLLVAEYCRLAYGPAAEAMERYYLQMSRNWDSTQSEVPYNFYAHQSTIAVEFLTPGRIGELQGFFTQALRAIEASGDEGRRAFWTRQIEIERKCFELWVEAFRKGLVEQRQVAVPFSRVPDDVHNGAELPEFTVQGRRADYPTRVRLVRDDEALSMLIVCEDPRLELLRPQVTEPGGKVWEDESIEIFLAHPGDPAGQYRHLVVNSLGVQFQEIVTGVPEFLADGGREFLTGRQPAWTAEVRRRENAWETQIRIPFRELDASTPLPDEEWRLMVIRSAGQRTDYRNSGFPTAAYHDYNSFGRIHFPR